MMKWKKRTLQVVFGIVMLITGIAAVMLLVIMDNSYLFDNAKNFFGSNKFSNEVQYYMESKIAELRIQEQLSLKVTPEDRDIVYKVLEYANIAEEETEGGVDYQKSVENANAVSFKRLCREQTSLYENVSKGIDAGTRSFFFYEEWFDESQRKMMDSTVNKNESEPFVFLRVSNQDYVELLKKYAVRDEELNGYTFINEKTNAIISYSFDEDGEFYSLDTLEYCYDYNCVEDIMNRKSFYFVSANLDWSSKEELEKSIITTAFTTVEESLSYFALQDWICKNSNYCEYSIELLEDYEFTYQVTLANGTIINDEYNTLDSSQIEKSITFYADSGSLDKNSEQECEKGLLNVNRNICDMLKEHEISSMTIYVPKELSIHTGYIGEKMQLYKLYLEQDIIAGVAVAGILICLCLIACLIRRERKEPLTFYDKRCLEVRSIVTALIVLGGVAFCGLIGTVITRELINVLFICMLLVYIVLYVAVYYYIVSIFRNICWKCGWSQIFTIRIIKNVKGKCNQLVRDMWNHQAVAKQSVIYCGGYAIFNLIGMFFLICTISSPFCVLVAIGIVLVNLYVCCSFYKERRNVDAIIQGLRKINEGDITYQIDDGNMSGYKKELAQLVNHVGEGLEKAVATSIRDERLKAELITNVSHDIKTPLTSIINYVDLLQREGIEEKPASEYIAVLEQKSQRLKQLIEDLVEASKASTGNIDLACTKLDMKELVIQTMGEFEDKLQEKELAVMADISDQPVCIYADGRRCFRIIENLFSNVYKYSLEHTRVYVSLQQTDNQVVFCIKNISKNPLSVDVEELSQRFVRGEESRTTEGSGLGLSIAKSLTELQNGEFVIALDGDLFKATVIFPKAQPSIADAQ